MNDGLDPDALDEMSSRLRQAATEHDVTALVECIEHVVSVLGHLSEAMRLWQAADDLQDAAIRDLYRRVAQLEGNT